MSSLPRFMPVRDPWWIIWREMEGVSQLPYSDRLKNGNRNSLPCPQVTFQQAGSGPETRLQKRHSRLKWQRQHQKLHAVICTCMYHTHTHTLHNSHHLVVNCQTTQVVKRGGEGGGERLVLTMIHTGTNIFFHGYIVKHWKASVQGGYQVSTNDLTRHKATPTKLMVHT